MEKNIKHRHTWLVVALYLLLVAAIAMPSTVSKYQSSASGSDTAVIARYDVSMVYGHDAQDLSNTLALVNMKPGETRTFYVKVMNDSDVSVGYTVKCVTEGNLPLNITINSKVGTLDYDVNNTKVVTVTVEWPAGENNPKYADMVDYLRVVVNFTQMD